MRRVSGSIPLRKWDENYDIKLRELYENGTPIAWIAEEMGCSAAAAQSRVRRLGIKRKVPFAVIARSVPADFAEVAPTMTRHALMKHYGAARATIDTWINETGVNCLIFFVRTIPETFATDAPNYTMAELSRLYCRSEDTIKRWLRKENVTAKKFVSEREVKERELKVLQDEQDEAFKNIVIKKFNNTIRHEAAQAANFLRKKYPSVFRCDIWLWEARRETWGDKRGLPQHGKDQYFISGRGVVWLDELIDLAESYGFCSEKLHKEGPVSC